MALALAQMRGRRRWAGWLMVLHEGRTEEGTRWGTVASGGALFKWRRGEQRKGACAAISSVGQSVVQGGRQRPPADGCEWRRCCTNRGEQWGAADTVRERLPGGAEQQRGPGGQQRGVGESERERGSTKMGR
jgi:hypothetical protein